MKVFTIRFLSFLLTIKIKCFYVGSFQNENKILDNASYFLYTSNLLTVNFEWQLYNIPGITADAML